MWYIIPHTKTKIIAHVHTCTRHAGARADFFWDVSIRNSLRSNKFRLEGAGMLSFGSKVTEKERTYTSYQKLPFGSGDDPDKLFFHRALN